MVGEKPQGGRRSGKGGSLCFFGRNWVWGGGTLGRGEGRKQFGWRIVAWRKEHRW